MKVKTVNTELNAQACAFANNLLTVTRDEAPHPQVILLGFAIALGKIISALGVPEGYLEIVDDVQQNIKGVLHAIEQAHSQKRPQ